MQKGQNNKNQFMIYAMFFVIIVLIIIVVGATAKTLLLDKSGCILRYTVNEEGVIDETKESFSTSVKIKANGNYRESSYNGGLFQKTNEDNYGQWKNTGIALTKGKQIELNISGQVSLCESKIDGIELKIPRIDDSYIPKTNEDEASAKAKLDFYSYGLLKSLDAANTNWTDLIDVGYLDKIKITIRISPNSIPGKPGYNINTTNISTLDVNSTKTLDSPRFSSTNCQQGRVVYDAKCSRFTPYLNKSVATDCSNEELLDKCRRIYGEQKPKQMLKCLQPYTDQFSWKEDFKCGLLSVFNAKLSCSIGRIKEDFKDGDLTPQYESYIKSSSTIPFGYSDDGKYTEVNLDTTDRLGNYSLKNFNYSCRWNQDNFPENINTQKFWFTNGNGLTFKDTLRNEEKIARSNIENSGAINYKEIYTTEIHFPTQCNNNLSCMQGWNTKGKLQYKFPSFSTQSRGGYLIGIKHSTCIRKNAIGFEGGQGFSDRGQLKYIVSTNDEKITENSIGEDVKLFKNDNSGSRAFITPDKDGVLYLRINNKREDYATSSGSYNVSVVQITKIEQIEDKINNFILDIKSKISNSALQIIKNMTCYGSDKTKCHNFFTYIKVILTLYISFMGYRMIMGQLMSTADFIKNLLKMIIIAGLINDNTFNVFITYINPMIWEFTDIMCANLAGTDNTKNISIDGKTTTILIGPIMIFNNLLSKLLFSKLLIAKLFATLSAGLMGIFYFVLAAIALIILVATIFKVLITYIFSFFKTGILLTMSPIFLTFILFKQTAGFFKQWMGELLEAIFHPIILIAGIAVLIQVFELYLDFAMPYSVCWKCSIYFRLPFKEINDFLSIPLFCLNWYAPWGMDTASDNITFSIANFAGLFMISYCSVKYIKIAENATSKIFK